MASNELAAILARRRAKAGEAGDAPTPVVASAPAPPAPSAAPAGGASAKPTNSIAERIARLKAQSAAAAASGDAAPTPVAIQLNRGAGSPPSPAGSSEFGEAASSTENLVAHRRTSEKIQQMQGSLGINVNPFGRPGGPRCVTLKCDLDPDGTLTAAAMVDVDGTQENGHGRELHHDDGRPVRAHARHGDCNAWNGRRHPDARTGQGGHAHPGHGDGGRRRRPASARSRACTRRVHDRMCLEPASDGRTVVMQATMTRAAGPKRRGPTRGPPPGAFRIPVRVLGQKVASCAEFD